MTAFLAGALGAVTVLFLLGTGAAIARVRHFRHRRLGFGHRRGLGFLFRRVGTRPEQEELLAREADALASELRAFRADGRALRAELGALLAAPALDAAAISALLDGPFARAREVRARVEAALLRVHGTLDAAQRERLAALVREGAHGRHHHA